MCGFKLRLLYENRSLKNTLCLFACSSFFSIAAGNILLGIATLLFYIYAYKNKAKLDMVQAYVRAIAFFLFTMLISALASGDIAYGLKRWADLWIWRMMPFVIIVLAVKEAASAKKILFCSLIGITIGVGCLIYQGIGGAHRATGFFGHPMTFAGYLCIYMPLLLIGFFDKRVFGKYNWLSGLLFIASFVALVFNATRGAWIAVAAVTLLILGYYACQSKKNMAIALLFVLVASTGLTEYKPFIARAKSITSTTNTSNTERFLMWNSAYRMFMDHPVFGVGLGQYKDNYQKKYISPKAKQPYLEHAHSNFMQMLAENGAVGFVGFMTLVGYFIIGNLVAFWKTKSPYAFSMACSVLALVLQGFTEYNFGNSAVMKVFWLVIGCLVVLDRAYKAEEKSV